MALSALRRIGLDAPLLARVASGGLLGLFGLRPLKVALGLLVGAATGGIFAALDADGLRRWSPRQWRSWIGWTRRSRTATGRWSE